jgi:hypothetical protein
MLLVLVPMYSQGQSSPVSTKGRKKVLLRMAGHQNLVNKFFFD